MSFSHLSYGELLCDLVIVAILNFPIHNLVSRPLDQGVFDNVL